MRRWLVSLLPDCPVRDDVLTVATELGGNAIEHTASGHGAWFAVEIAVHRSVVQIAVADCGGQAEPRVIDDPAAERGRGLLLVRGLSLRTGVVGDQRGRLVWAEISWGDAASPASASPQAGYQAAVREGEAALARRFAGVPTWFGHSTLTWWAVAGSHGLVSAPTARELAGLLCRLLDASSPSQAPASELSADAAAARSAARPRRRSDVEVQDAGGRRYRSESGQRPGRDEGRRGSCSDLMPRQASAMSASLVGA